MEQAKYQQLFQIVQNINEENAENQSDLIKLLFKKILIGDGEIKVMQDLWFEKEEIKTDIEYYQIIISLIDTFILHFSEKKKVKEDLLAKEIFSNFQNTKLFYMYKTMIEMSKLFGFGDKYYIDIACGLYILGCKKGTPVNKYLIETLKDFSQVDIIINSRFCSQMKSINYDNINEFFMKNLLLLYNLIISKEDEEKIKLQIMMLEKPEELKDQKIRAVSTLFENIHNDENKLNGGIKNNETSSPSKEEENPEKNPKNEKENNITNEGGASLIINEKKLVDKNYEVIDKKANEIDNKAKEENICIKNNEIMDNNIIIKNKEVIDKNAGVKNKNKEVVNKNTTVCNEDVMNEKINVQYNEVQDGNKFMINNVDVNEKIFAKDNEIVTEKKHISNGEETIKIAKEENKKEKLVVDTINSSQIIEKEDIIIPKKEDKINENEIKNVNETISMKPIKKEFHDISLNNKEKIDVNDSLENIFEFIKKKLENSNDDERGKENNVIVNLIMPIFQRHNRYNNIIQQLSITKNTIKEIESFQLVQKQINGDKIEIEKCLIEINRIKSIINSLKIPSIINVKRKILDLLIFSLLKINQDKFNLDKNYCPKKSFLDKILAKLTDYSKNVLRKDEIEKIEQHKKDINELIDNNKTIIEFPYSCSDNTLNDIMRYLGFCKGKYNKIVHISEEELKYYLYLPFNNKLEPKFKELLNIFIVYDKNKSEKNNSDSSDQNKIEDENEDYNGNEEKEMNSIYKKPLKIKFNTALDFFLKDNIGIDEDNSKLEKKFEEIESKKNLFLDKYSDCVKDGWKQLFNLYDKFDNNEKRNNNMNIFYSNEKILINDTTKDFEDTLKALEANLLELKEVKDVIMMKELINQFFSKYHKIIQKELEFDSDKYLNLCETVEGRYILVFFQIQLIKYQLLDLYSKKFALILNVFYEINKTNIMTQLLELKNQSSILLDEIKKINSIKSPKKLFVEWKFSRGMIINNGFETFINGIKSYASSIELKLNADLISDQTTSLWLIKNDLDKYVD